MNTGGTTRRRLLAATTLVLVVPLALSACTGGSDKGTTTGPQAGDGPLAAAQQKLLDTSGVDLTLTASKLPRGVDGVRRLSGTLTAAPAFKGKVGVRVNDLTATLPMVAVDGAVYAQLPFTDSYAEIDPAAYGAPDPAELLDPEHGLAGWLGETQGPQKSDDGKVVTGTIPGQVVAGAVPSAAAGGTFQAEWHLDGDGLLEDATITGPFYGKAKDVTYALDLGEYDLSPDITDPTQK
ncbi:LppX_LprAFG lipoprotein [Nocardioides marmoribigeumensis]|uniref:Lipoprotein LprG n=1 Tax=Nocardioides marmoribigeumensis TaxID=433649 RepID=A0ABU2BRB8_9ACTN|nr:LppX_LprAFG lipoprotein [Nocardioides marmoribigeumensis]MDR7361177.1 lipoprotein LprG [Nocardioides marmoribigeumensis]